MVGGGYSSLNSRYTDTQPALSGNGRYVALISNRSGHQEVALYDIQRNKFVVLPQLNRRRRLLESPSLSRSARYIVYLASDRGRPRVELYDRRTKRYQVLTSGGHGSIRNPSISLDGRYVAFESGRKGQWDIQVIDRGNQIDLDLPPGVRPVQPSQEQPQ